jgi:subtilisin family serine protease/outer membrane protein OmpA-like peptidoglycan-associated protein
MLRSTYRRSVFAVISGALLIAAATAGATDQKDPTEILRSLAPIEYLPHHSGIRGPAIDLSIPFALGSAELKPEGRAQLRALGEALASDKLKNQAIEIAGHTDSSGEAEFNRRLSERRAQAVKNFLIERFGFSRERFRVVGYGEDELKNPLVPRASENRRVEISVIAAGASSRAPAPARQQQMSATNGFDLRIDPVAAEALRARAKRDGGVRVIVGLAAIGAPSDDIWETHERSGWQSLNDHIRSLQGRALNRLGWTNFNNLVRFDYTPAMAMRVNANRLDELLTSNAITQVYEDALNSFSLSQSVPLIGVESGNDGEPLGSGVSVAVIDTGVDGNHPFLRGKLVAEACFSAHGLMGPSPFRSACPSGKDEEIGIGAGRPCPETVFACDHGTHVAGIAAGAGDTFSGVAAAANIVAVQVSIIIEGTVCGELGKCSSSLDSNVIRALEWVFFNREKYKIAAINLSLGSGRYEGRCDQHPMRRAYALLRRVGIVVVSSSGNDGFENSMGLPACISEVVSVGATTYADTVAEFSNSSAYLDFLAPGATLQPIGRDKGILSSVPGNRFLRFEGTSMAAPHVAGAVAALKAAVPAATAGEIIEAMRLTGPLITDTRNGRSQPRIQVDTAIAKLQQMVAARPVEAKPEPKPKTSPKPQSIDGIRIENGESAIGEDGKIEW